jgi:hypothetical protein
MTAHPDPTALLEGEGGTRRKSQRAAGVTVPCAIATGEELSALRKSHCSERNSYDWQIYSA